MLAAFRPRGASAPTVKVSRGGGAEARVRNADADGTARHVTPVVRPPGTERFSWHAEVGVLHAATFGLAVGDGDVVRTVLRVTSVDGAVLALLEGTPPRAPGATPHQRPSPTTLTLSNDIASPRAGTR